MCTSAKIVATTLAYTSAEPAAYAVVRFRTHLPDPISARIVNDTLFMSANTARNVR